LPHQLFTEQHSPSANPRHVEPLVPPHFPSVEVSRLGVELGAEDDELARVAELLDFVLEVEATLEEALLDNAVLTGIRLEEIEVEVATEEDDNVLLDETVLELEALTEDTDDELAGLLDETVDELRSFEVVIEDELMT
jgi:hypothetical protein